MYVTSMIKKTDTGIKLPLATIVAGASEVYASVASQQLDGLKLRVNSAARRAQNYGSEIRDARANVRHYLLRIEEYKQERKRNEQTLRAAKKAVDSFDSAGAQAGSLALLAKVAKLKYIESVTGSDGRLVVETRLIFTDIRTYAGERETARRCIGAFEITVDFTEQSVKIKNKMFVVSGSYSGLSHWAIKNAEPCRGDHQDAFQNALQERDLYVLLEVIYHFLLSTDDGGAYCRSHDWIKLRNDNYTSPLRKGNYVYITRGYEGYEPSEHGSYGLIHRSNGSIAAVELKDTFNLGHDLNGLLPSDSTRGYMLPKQGMYKISKAQYDAENVELAQVRQNNVLDTLDALPFGSTLSEGNKIIDTV